MGKKPKTIINPTYQKIIRKVEVKHLAGIIPINSYPMEFNFPWPDCMQPIGTDFLAIDRAVLECAYAGCNSIWIICPQSQMPLLKRRLKESISNPTDWMFKKTHFTEALSKPIPIYYAPVLPKDHQKRDSLVWHSLYGCYLAYKIGSSISKFLQPNKYYITFPNTLYDHTAPLKYRTKINNMNRFFISFEGKTILDGLPLGCALAFQDIRELVRIFRSQATGLYTAEKKPGEINPHGYLPIEDRYTGRWLTISDVFMKLEKDEQNTILSPVDWFYDITTWDGLMSYYASMHSKLLKPFNKYLLTKTKYLHGVAKTNT